MDEGLIARRYAKAVFRYAQELNATDAVYEKMKLFEKNYAVYLMAMVTKLLRRWNLKM